MTGQALTGPGGLLAWEPRDIATLMEQLEDEADAARDAARRRG